MKQLALFLSILTIQYSVNAQQTINGSITHDDIQRDYILYVPAIYSDSVAVPLVYNFHGYGSSAAGQMNYGDFRSIADTAGFLIVHPQGTLFNGTTHWNVGGWTIGSTTDDVGFIDALLDSLSATYNIEPTRIYSTGMSNGGYMSFLLACQLNDRIAAIASVTGSMTPETYIDCDPQHPTPIMQMHGTADNVVPYAGTNWSRSIEDVLEYWVGFNNCNTNPVITEIPDLDPNDGSTVEHNVYDNGDNGVVVDHFKVIGGGHTWPGNVYGGEGTNNDIDASAEIWNFFSKYDIYGLIGTTDIVAFGKNDAKLTVYPNPTHLFITVDGNFNSMDYEIISIMGKSVMKGVLDSNSKKIDLSFLSPNVYFIRIGGQTLKILKTD